MRNYFILLFITMLLLSFPSAIYCESYQYQYQYQDTEQIRDVGYDLAYIFFAITILILVTPILFYFNKRNQDVYKWSPIFTTLIAYIFVSFYAMNLDFYDYYANLFTLAFIHTSVQHFYTRKTVITYISKQQGD
jgi:hypothetical protein